MVSIESYLILIGIASLIAVVDTDLKKQLNSSKVSVDLQQLPPISHD